MFPSRFLKYINIFIGLSVVAAGAAGYWVLWRPLPRTSGSVRAPVSEAAEVMPDARGVPHILAASEDDLLFVQGYVTAQDRMFQMDVLRRRALGELAEVFGPAGLEADQTVRTLGLPHLSEQHVEELSSEDRRAFAAYVRGVNCYLETNPPAADFVLLGYRPRPWRIADSLAIALDLFRTLSETWREDLLRESLLPVSDREKLKALYPVRSDIAPAVGSNAWAISGRRTASGKPLLAGDPHLECTVPPLWYQVHLQAPGLHAAGMSLPGLPGVVIGHNERIAWSMTNLHFDVQDLYLERLDPVTGRYLAGGEVRQAARRLDRILVRGGRPATTRVWVTHHGPVVFSQGNLHAAMRWVAAERGVFRYPFLRVNRAGGWEEFRAALAEHPGPAQNFIYADVDGNIGYQAAGRLPRRDFDGDVPVDGASGRFEWQGFVPVGDLPSLFNPPSGVIVSANQNPFPEQTPYRIGGRFDAGYRARRIRELIETRSDWSAEDQFGIQTDIYDGFLHFLAGQAAAAVARRGAEDRGLDQVAELLRAWDGRMERGAAAALAAYLLYRHARRAVAARASQEAGLRYDAPMAAAVVEHLLRERPDGWFDDYDGMLVESLADALDEGRRMQGDDPRRWQWGRYNLLRLSGGVTARLPLVGRFFRLAPEALSGSPQTVLQVNGGVLPSMRLVADLAEWNRSRAVIPFGQSGHRLSPHFRDQWKAYREGRGFPMEFRMPESANRLRFAAER